MRKLINRIQERFMTDEQWEKRREQRHKEVDEALARSKEEYDAFLEEVRKGVERGR